MEPPSGMSSLGMSHRIRIFGRSLLLLAFLAVSAGCEGDPSQRSDDARASGTAASDTSVRAALPDTIETLDYKIQTEVVTSNLEEPWAIDFIGSDTALVTEQPGRLRLLVDEKVHQDSIHGTPKVSYEGGQGGLLDVAVDPNYDQNGWIYLSYAHGIEVDTSAETLAMTRVVRGRIRDHAWTQQQILFEAPHATYRTTRQQFGSRIAFDSQEQLYFSVGDRGNWPLYPPGVMRHAQELHRPNGKIHRIHRNGAIPEENPFVGRDSALASIYTYGHRNPQGLATHPETGEVWALEHGPRGGDELNRLRAGGNYGWGEITYGINYDGSIITRERRKKGMEQPIVFWRPSIATSGLSFYQGDDFPYWQNQILLGSLKAQELRLLTMTEECVMHQEVILKGAGRIREAVPGPDGAIYVVLNAPDRIVRLSHLADFTARN